MFTETRQNFEFYNYEEKLPLEKLKLLLKERPERLVLYYRTTIINKYLLLSIKISQDSKLIVR